eukprot:Rhum_TRINITY_DN8836_c0_g1::Rhum_TRINITY_DN8836_c0_g1_i1::g.29941::m.29941
MGNQRGSLRGPLQEVLDHARRVELQQSLQQPRQPLLLRACRQQEGQQRQQQPRRRRVLQQACRPDHLCSVAVGIAACLQPLRHTAHRSAYASGVRRTPRRQRRRRRRSGGGGSVFRHPQRADAPGLAHLRQTPLVCLLCPPGAALCPRHACGEPQVADGVAVPVRGADDLGAAGTHHRDERAFVGVGGAGGVGSQHRQHGQRRGGEHEVVGEAGVSWQAGGGSVAVVVERRTDSGGGSGGGGCDGNRLLRRGCLRCGGWDFEEAGAVLTVAREHLCCGEGGEGGGVGLCVRLDARVCVCF